MTRLPLLERDDVAPEHHDLLDRELNLMKVLLHSPGGARAVARLGNWIRSRSTLDPRLRELAILKVGHVSGAAYEYSHHVRIGRHAGLADDEIRAVGEESGGSSVLGEVERLVVRAAGEMTEGTALSDETFAGLARHLSDEELTDLVIVVAFYNGVVRILESLEVDIEPEYLPLLDEFPLAGH